MQPYLVCVSRNVPLKRNDTRLQGAVCTGIWVIAHECGHQAFSKYKLVNDGVGLVLHSCLLVPYFSW